MISQRNVRMNLFYLKQCFLPHDEALYKNSISFLGLVYFESENKFSYFNMADSMGPTKYSFNP